MKSRIDNQGRTWVGGRVYTGRACVPGERGYPRYEIRYCGDVLVCRYGWSRRSATLLRRVMAARAAD